MEELLNEIPNLKLNKTIETRSVHRNDLNNPLYKDKKVGDIITFEIWRDQNCNVWSRADVLYYIKLEDIHTRYKQVEPKSELEFV